MKFYNFKGRAICLLLLLFISKLTFSSELDSLKRIFHNLSPDSDNQQIYELRKALAEGYLQEGSYVDGLSMLTGAIEMLVENNQHERLFLLEKVGEVYSQIKDYSKSNAYWVQALRLAHIVADSGMMVRLYYNLAINHKALGNLESSMGYYYSSLGMAQTYIKPNWAFSCYLEIGEIRLELQNFSKAREYFTMALEHASSFGYEYGIIISNLNLGIAFFHEQRYKEALPVFYRTLDLIKASETRDTALLLRIYEGIGKTYLGMKQYKEALNMLLSSLDLARSINANLNQRRLCYIISETYVLMNRHEEANNYLMQYIKLEGKISQQRLGERQEREKIKNELFQRQLDLSYAQSKMDQLEYDQLKKSRFSLFFILLCCGMTIATMAILWLLKTKYTSNLNEKQLLIKQLDVMQTHNKRLKTSNQSLEEFAYVVSHDLREPLRMISTYAGLIKRRYEDKLDDDGKDFLGYITEAVGRMSRLLRDSLEYSRLTNQEMNVQNFNSGKLVEYVLQNLTTIIEEKNAKINIEALGVFTKLCHSLILLEKRSPKVLTSSRLMVDQ